MPVVGMGPQGDMLSPHSRQLPDHTIASGFSAPMLSSVAMSATAIGQAVGVISSAASRPSSTLPTSTPITTSSKQLTASRPDVICPLSNLDGSSCRKKCSGTFAYRSICEHIRRAHPEHWIPRLPASVESFNKMIQTPPAARGANSDQGPATSGAVQPNNHGGTIRRSNTSSGVKPRTKVTKVKQPIEEQDASCRTLASGTSASEAQGAASALVEARELHTRNSHHSNMASETDTESDHTHSPASPLSMPVLPTATLPVTSGKASPGAKSKTPSLRKKPSGTSGSKTKSSPRKVPTRRRTIDKKTSSSALPSLYSTPSASNDDLHSLNDGADMMDVDTDSTPQQHYVFGYGNTDVKPTSKGEEHRHELDGNEAGLIMNGFSKTQNVSNTQNHSTPQLRRSYSFSAGDCNGHNGSPSSSSGVRFRGNLAVDTSIGYEYDKSGMQSGSMSAGGIMGGESTGGSRWHDLIEAAIAATKENKVSEKKSPLLYQSVLPVISRGSATPRHNTNQQPDSDIPPSLRMMMDIASAEANLDGPYGQQPQNIPLDHALSQSCTPNYPPHPQHHYMQNGDAYNRHQNGYSTSSYQFHHNYSGNAVSHTNISPILNGASLASLDSSTVASHASTPTYSKPSSPHVETTSTLPKVECSMCHAQVDISMSFACTECIHGFCHRCVMPSETSNMVETGKDGSGSGFNKWRITSPDRQLRNGDGMTKRLPFSGDKSLISKCGICGVQGAKFKPIRLIVRV